MARLLLIAFFCFFYQINSLSLMREKYVKINRFIGFCEGEENVPMGYYNISIVSQDKVALMNAKLIVKKDLGSQIRMTINLKRCKSLENPDTCEDFKTLNFNKLCDLYNKKGPWSNIFERTHPRIYCPIKAGNYTLENATVDTANSLIPAEGWIWQVTARGFDKITNEPYFCNYIEVEII